jgi:hypothetical protein
MNPQGIFHMTQQVNGGVNPLSRFRSTSENKSARTGVREFLKMLVAAALLVSAQAMAELSVTPITWDVVGLSHNRPLTQGPDQFPVGARVCNESGADIEADVVVDFVWDDNQAAFFGDPGADPYINLRQGSLDQIVIPEGLLSQGACFDAYFEIRLTRSSNAFGNTRPYFIEASIVGGSQVYSTPPFRQIYIEGIISQNRNTVLGLRLGQQADGSDWVPISGGATMALGVGQTYFLEKTTQTATGYEQLQSFVTLSNVLFRVVDVETMYGTISAGASQRISQPHSKLYGDACLWDADTQSPNYLSCRSTGKVGGLVTTVYQIEILSLPPDGSDITLATLIYDLSGGSYHYNTDFNDPTKLRNIRVFDPKEDASISKRFIPSTIAADGVSTLRFTITNPNPIEVSGYAFQDELPGDMVVAGTPNVSNSCGGTLTANAGSPQVLFQGGTIVANSSCTIQVDVTVPFDAEETYPLELLNEVALYVDDDPANPAGDPADTAQATLNVNAGEPPPLVCTQLDPNTEIATWGNISVNDPANAPLPTFLFSGADASALGGGGLNFEINNQNNSNNEWRSRAQVANQTLAQARSTNAYYEIRLDTTGLTSVNFALFAYNQNVNAPQAITLDYGPAGGSLTPSVATLSPVPQANQGAANLIATGLTNLNSDGDTLFRVYAYAAPGTNAPLRIRDISLQGEGEFCFPAGGADDPPDPPAISKEFDPNPVAVGQTSTLTFTLENNNALDLLTGITFRDELPDGMVAIGGFDNIGCGGTWGLEGGDSGILLFEGGSLTALGNCTLAVNVQSTTVGPNDNLSDPVNSNQTSAGNSARDILVVTPPPPPAIIVKQFEPNLLLLDDPNAQTGEATLRFSITNIDPVLTISNVSFVDQLPAGMEPAEDPLNFTATNCGSPMLIWDDVANVLEFSNGTIAPGETETCDISLTVEVDLSGHDFATEGELAFVNQTSPITHVFNGIVITGNDASATLIVDTPIPGVALLKEVGPTDDAVNGAWSNFMAVDLDGDVFYRLTVENTGEAVLTDIAVNDQNVDTSGCPWETIPNFELPVADVADPEAHIAVCVVGPVVADTEGFFTNTATVTANPGSVSDVDSAAYATTGLELVKTILSIDGDTEKSLFDRLGQVIEYQFTVTNVGHAALRDPVVIDDPLLGGDWYCPPLTEVGPTNDNFLRPGDPAPDGEQIVCTGTYTVTIDDLENMQVLNVAAAEADGVRTLEDDANLSGALDFGDAPESYGTLLVDGGPRHVVGGPWMPDFEIEVGTLGDPEVANDTSAETDGQPDDDADADQANDGVELADLSDQPASGGVTCDGVFLENSEETFYYCAAVRVANPTSDVARLVGWVDFVGTGDFDGSIDRSLPTLLVGERGLADFEGSCSDSGLDAGEQLTAGNWGIPPNCEGVVVVVWQYTGNDTLTTEKTFARFRISTDTRDNFDSDPSPMGFLADGEIEDHALDAGTIPVSIHAFESRYIREGLEVVWSTASETHNQGFYLWGETSRGGFELLTPEMVASTATDIAQPNVYRVVVPGLQPGSVRDLVITAVDYFGKEDMYGYFRVGEAFGRENPTDNIDWHDIRVQAESRLQRLGHVRQGALWRANTQRVSRSIVAADFEVQGEGMQRITFDDLLTSGLDLTGVAVDQIAVMRAGEGVPRQVVRSKGSDRDDPLSGIDSNRRPTFGPGMEIHFWGEKPSWPDALYIDHYVYRVKADADRAISTPIHRVPIAGGSDIHLVGERVAEANHYHFTNPNPDPWYMKLLRSSGSNTEYATTFKVPATMRPDQAGEALVRVGGLTIMPVSPNNRIQVLVNGQVVEDYYFSNQTSQLIRAYVPAGLLVPGENLVQVRSPGGLGVSSMALLDSVELRWAEPINAVHNRALVRQLVGNDSGGVRVGGYTTNERVEVYGFRNGILVQIHGHQNRGVVMFPELGIRGVSYWASPASAFETPAALGGVASNDLMNGLGEFVVLAHPAFMPVSAREHHPLNDFIVHRSNQGWDVSLVDISEVQVQYGGGMPLPDAVNRFLADAQAEAGTSHVLLVGSDSYDYRDHLGMGSLNFIPTHYAETYVVKHSPSDGLLADINGDGVSDLALGRWPVRTLADLEATVQKVFDFEFNVAGLQNAVWMTDQLDPRTTSFSSQVNRLGNLLIDGGWSEQNIDYIIYEDLQGGDLPTPMAARLALFDALESGRTLTGFTGHGSPTLWSFQGILRPNDVADLNNVGLPTLVSTLACYTTYFVSPFSNTLAHRLMNGLQIDADGNPISGIANGAVAIHGAGTLSNLAQNEVFMRRVLTAQQAGYTLGQAVLMARQEAAANGINDLVVNWTLLGDPTLRLD